MRGKRATFQALLGPYESAAKTGLSDDPSDIRRTVTRRMPPPLAQGRFGRVGDRVFPNTSSRTDDTSSVIRLARDRRMPPSPQGEGFGRAAEGVGPYRLFSFFTLLFSLFTDFVSLAPDGADVTG